MIVQRDTFAILVKQQSVLSFKGKVDRFSRMRPRHFWWKPYDQGFITGCMTRMEQQAFAQKFEAFCHAGHTAGGKPQIFRTNGNSHWSRRSMKPARPSRDMDMACGIGFSRD
jgi:hypothetical protein